ncbi:hypothetical protein A1D22_00610 [Pasteurellaceae bacterium LFhippo2]|nr:hypothetical protein [Pasteurellaceae bacterium LFhippo2]
MPNYRRDFLQGGTYFFTLALQNRKKDLLIKYINELREAYKETLTHCSFKTIAICILPDHLHWIIQLPENENDFSKIIRIFKTNFSKRLPKECHNLCNVSRRKRKELGVWQRRFWEHRIRDDGELYEHICYVYYNPVKHGYVTNVSDWRFSSFHKDVKNKLIETNWGNNCDIKQQNLYND